MDVCGCILIICLSSFVSVCDTNIDGETLCVHMKSCVLPCRFTPGSDLYIQWIKRDGGGLTVHSFRHDQNQDMDQYLDYRGRTSLFEEEKIRGNASLQLRDVTVKDEGRYLCLVNGQVTYVNMKVFAPVLQVHIDVRDGNLICHAHNIYPEPSLKWTMNPEAQVSVNRSETGLFSVYSSVPLWRTTLYKYTCTVSTEHSTKSTTYEGTERTHLIRLITCVAFIVVCCCCCCCCCCSCWRRRRNNDENWNIIPDTPGESRADTVTDVDTDAGSDEHL